MVKLSPHSSISLFPTNQGLGRMELAFWGALLGRGTQT